MDTKTTSRAVARSTAKRLRAAAADTQGCAAIDREIEAELEAELGAIVAQRFLKPGHQTFSEYLEATAAKVLAEAGL